MSMSAFQHAMKPAHDVGLDLYLPCSLYMSMSMSASTSTASVVMRTSSSEISGMSPCCEMRAKHRHEHACYVDSYSELQFICEMRKLL